MSNTLQISFQIKNTKLNKRSLAPIYCRITIDGVRKEFSIGRRIEPGKWNRLGFADGRNEEAKSLNAYLSAIRFRLSDLHRKMLEGGDSVSTLRLYEIYEGKQERM